MTLDVQDARTVVVEEDHPLYFDPFKKKKVAPLFNFVLLYACIHRYPVHIHLEALFSL